MQKTIACIDFSNDGHRLHLMRSLIKTIISDGNKAVCITNNTNEIKNWIDSICPENSHQVIYHAYNYIEPKEIKWNQYIHDIFYALQTWKQYNTLLNDIEKTHSIKIDVVVFNTIDVLLSCLMPIFLQKMVFKFHWAGLYVHTRYMRMFKHLGVQTKKAKITDIDYLFKSNKCIGVGIFDNGIAAPLQFRLDRKVTIMPDISDVSTNNTTYALATEIKNAANGKIIIGVIGISYYSGCVDMAKLAIACKSNDYLFVFCGEFQEVSYQYIPNEEDKIFLQKFRENPPVNCFWKEGYLKDEFEYNAVFNIFDIIYMIYPEHYTSSNRLTKAAFFHKFVLAANQHCVGENVVRYELGEVAEPTNITQQLEKLDVLKQKINTKNFPIKQWQQYYTLNDEIQLQKQLKLVLNS